MAFKYHSYAGSEDAATVLSAIERDNVMDASSFDSRSEPASDSSSPRNGHSIMAHSKDSTPLMDVWLGEKYLQSIIALQLHSQADEEDAISSLESKLKANLQDFPFGKCCGYLHKRGAGEDFDLGGTKDYRNALLSYVGHVAQEGIRLRETLARNAITRFVITNPVISGLPSNGDPHIHNQRPAAHDIRPHGPDRGSPSTRIETPREQCTALPTTQTGYPPMHNGIAPIQSGTSVRTSESPPTIRPRESPPTIRPSESPPTPGDYAKYTSLLTEQAVYFDAKLIWHETDIGNTERPFFRCVVTFRGVTAQGEGRKKKDAKHEAAFKACQILGLQL